MKKIVIYTILFGVFLFPAVEANAQFIKSPVIDGNKNYIEGIEAFEMGDFERSKELLHAALDKIGPKPGVHYALMDVYLRLNDLGRAALYGKQAVEKEPENKWYRLKLVEVYRAAGQNQATINELNKLLEIYPNDIDALITLAETYRSYGEPLRSNSVLNRVLKLTGANTSVHYQKFLNFQATGNQDSALVELKEIQKLDPDNLNTHQLMSEIYQKKGMKNEAKTSLKEALRRNGRDTQSLVQLAGLYIDDAKWDSAGTLMGTIMEDVIAKPEAKITIAQYMYARQANEPGNIKLRIETERVMDMLTENEPDYAPAFSLAGEYYAFMQEFEKAESRLIRATELSPEDEFSWRQLLQVFMGQNKYSETIENGIIANQKVPEDAFIQFFVGSAYMLNDEPGQAIEWLQLATAAPARRPFKSAIYSTLGDALNSVDNWEEAEKAYQMAIRLDGENFTALNNYAYGLSVKQIKLEEAKEMALKAIEGEPENAAFLDTAGWVYYMLKDFDRARRFIKAAIDTGAASAEVYEHMGDVYEKLDDPAEAKKWWRKAYEDDSTRTHLKERIQ